MLEIDPQKTITKELHQYLLSSIGPRPIALASTIDAQGNNNVSPFSFFNIFSANPPIAIFSPARRVRNNTTKDTLTNIQTTKEVVINIVNYDIVEQTSLASNEYPSEIDEFVKAGFTPIKSKKVKPLRVKESPIQLECKVNQIIQLGVNGGAGNLIISEIIMIHIDEHILDENKKIDPNKIKLVGRMGSNWYSKAFNDALFKIKKPSSKLGIGFDNIPQDVKANHIFNKNDLAKLGGINKLPSKNERTIFKKDHPNESKKECYLKAKKQLDNGDIKNAWLYLLSY